MVNFEEYQRFQDIPERKIIYNWYNKLKNKNNTYFIHMKNPKLLVLSLIVLQAEGKLYDWQGAENLKEVQKKDLMVLQNLFKENLKHAKKGQFIQKTKKHFKEIKTYEDQLLKFFQATSVTQLQYIINQSNKNIFTIQTQAISPQVDIKINSKGKQEKQLALIAQINSGYILAFSQQPKEFCECMK